MRYQSEFGFKLVKSEGNAGYDLSTGHEITLKPGQKVLVHTGIHVELPNGYWGEVKGRSGMSIKFDTDPLAGVIDANYRGEIKVNLHNTGTETRTFAIGDRIAQMVIQKCEHIEWELTEDDLTETDRGDNGFHSSGFEAHK